MGKLYIVTGQVGVVRAKVESNTIYLTFHDIVYNFFGNKTTNHMTKIQLSIIVGINRGFSISQQSLVPI